MSIAVLGAMETWAAASAGPSFNPSPTIRTRLPQPASIVDADEFSGWKQLGFDLVDVKPPRQHLYWLPPVARNDFHLKSGTSEIADCLLCTRTDCILDDESR